jgi:hypothetical protein
MSAKREIVVALCILFVASLVLVPKFVVSRTTQKDRSHETQKETCDPIFAASTTRYVPPC